MKWLTLAGILLYLTRHADAGALRCSPNSQDPSCASGKRALILPQKEPSPEVECLAGSEWESNCHNCRCSESGFAQCVKQDSCDLKVLKEPIKCKPQTTFKRECNFCTCLDNGLGLCTLMGCVDFPLPQKTYQKISVSKRETTNSVKLKVIQKECRPNEVFELDCNTCRCNADGSSFSCTRRACVDTEKNSTAIRKTRATQSEAPKACLPGIEFRMDCNKCLCNDEGRDFSCTRIDCSAQNGNGDVDSSRSKREASEPMELKCVPGSVFDRECNPCRCTIDGLHAVCSIKQCKKDKPEPSTEPTQSFRCNPGDQFKRDCNDCTCSADGKTVFCALTLCDPPGL